MSYRDLLKALQDGELSLEGAKEGIVSGRNGSRIPDRPEVPSEEQLPTVDPVDASIEREAEPIAVSIGQLQDELVESLAAALYMETADLELDKPFIDLGLDSIVGVEWVNVLNNQYGLKITATKVYDYPDLDAFSQYIRGLIAKQVVSAPVKPVVEKPAEEPELPAVAVPEVSLSKPIRKEVAADDIAIIGMAGQFPEADDLDAFWRNLAAGKNSITEIPADRWSAENYYDADPQAPGKSNGKWMGALGNVAEFDPLFFNITPADAKWMDPQQRLFLQNAWHCIEDAGISPASLSGSACGVYVGCGSSDYVASQGGHNAKGLVGGSISILASRISYLLNLRGPCLAIDTACSSSLVAIAEACNNLLLGNCDLALAGGVYVTAGPSMHIITAKAGMLSDDGRCFTFDSRANGFVPGEGVGSILLKRLSDAVADGDRIQGVIKGWGINQDGKTNGITAPSVNSQIELEKKVYQRFGIDPQTISLVEAHGTGTKLGDPIEIEALTESFRAFTDKKGYCAIGSVKTNIGHLLPAAGIAGVIKVLLALRHKQLPPSLNYETLNPHIEMEGSPFYVNQTLKPWQSPEGQLRRACVSSFGLSGTNSHMVIEEYAETQPQASSRSFPPVIVLVSAKSKEALRESVQNLKGYVETADAQLSLHDLAYTLQVGRDGLDQRLAMIVESREVLLQRLDQFLSGDSDTSGVFRGRIKAGKAEVAAFKADEDMEQILEMWVSKQRYAKLLNMWVKGLHFDWHRLYSKEKPRRISLPLYPFERERYWLDAKYPAGVDAVEAVIEPAPAQTAPKPEAPVVEKLSLTPAHTHNGFSAPDAKPSAISLADPVAATQRVSTSSISASKPKPKLQALVAPTPTLATDLSPSAAKAVELYSHKDGIYCVQMVETNDHSRLSPDLVAGVQSCIRLVQTQADSKVILLQGQPKCFLTCGIDADDTELRNSLLKVILECELPIIAVVEGSATGTGCLLASFCDFIICSQEAHYSGLTANSDAKLSVQEHAYLRKRFGDRLGEGLALARNALPGTALRLNGQSLQVLARSLVTDGALSLARDLAGAPKVSLLELKRHLSRGSHALAEQLLQPSAASLELPEAVRPAEENYLNLGKTATVPAGEAKRIPLASDVVRLEAYANGVLLVTLCDETSKNTFSETLSRGLSAAFEHIGQTKAYKVVVLSGYGNYFACGGTKDALLAIQEGSASFTDSKLSGLPLDCEIPVIAAMQGHGIGAGWTLGMFCDYTLFSEESIYHSPYMQYGFTPGAGSTLIFPERFGHDLGWEILFRAKEYKGHTLKGRSIPMPVLPRAEVLSRGLAMAHELAASSRESLITAKTAKCAKLRAKVESFYTEELAMHAKTFVGSDEVKARIVQHFGNGMAEPSLAAAQGSVMASAESDSVDEAAMLSPIIQTLRETLADELHMKLEKVEVDTPFIEMGLDSINSVTWIREVNTRYGLMVAATEVYNYPTILDLANYVLKLGKQKGLFMPNESSAHVEAPEMAKPVRIPLMTPNVEQPGGEAEASTPADELPIKPVKASRTVQLQDIAVVGMSGQFPKAKNIEAFWENLLQGKDCISEVPAGRWSVDAFYDPEPKTQGKTYSKWMGILEDADKFDPLFFNISPLEAESMDPQQRIFLEACWKSFEDAGYTPKALAESKCGVFVGCGTGDYGLSYDSNQMDATALMGGSMSILSARISYLLNLRGPCVAMDTACSSSLVAIASACDSLTLGSSNLALAGGVCVLAGPMMHLMTSQAGMLSPDGRCFTFDQRANGFVPGEGVGVVLLKRLEDAERDNDSIHGVIRGWGVNQDGKTNGITAPNGDAQTSLEQEVYERFELDPSSIQMVETHGTGTKLGDPIEVNGLKAAFGHTNGSANHCAIGSAKSNIGHLLHASGVAGVIKSLMALKHRTLPPTIHFENLNEHIHLEDSPFYVSTSAKPWESIGLPRRAAVSSFGFSGTNAHLVLEEYVQDVAPASKDATEPVIFVLSAKNAERLKVYVADIYEHLTAVAEEAVDLAALCYTLQVGRSAMKERLGLVVHSVGELKSKLNRYLSGEAVDGLRANTVKRADNGLPDVSQRGAVRQWIAQKASAQLLDVWIGGYELNWNELYGSSKPRRISLPTYPFARDRYWKGGAQQGKVIQKSTPEPQVSRPTPTEIESATVETRCYQAVWEPAPVAPSLTTPEYLHRILFTCGLGTASMDAIASKLPSVECIPLRGEGDTLGARFEESALQVFERIKDILEQKPSGKVLVQVLVSTVGEREVYSGLAGLLRTARRENPRLIGQLIEVDLEATIVEKLIESAAHADDVHVCYATGQRQLPKLQAIAGNGTTVNLPWKDQGVYLITGGMGGLGRLFAREIAEQIRGAHLILTGRSELERVDSAFLKTLEAKGATVLYRQADMSDVAAVDRLIEGIDREFGRIDGILHAAGVNLDNYIIRKSSAEFQQVLAAKVAGSVHLDRATFRFPLDFFVLFSSSSALAGNPGQADYATANAFMDAYAAYRNGLVEAQRRSGQTLSINWPLWKEGGMQIDAATEAVMLAQGHAPLSTTDGMKAFYAAMASGLSRVAVATETASSRSPDNQDLAENALVSPVDDAQGAVNREALTTQVLERLRELLSTTMKLRPDQIDDEEPFENYGIDSVMVTRLNQKLAQVFAEAPQTLLFEVQTLDALASYCIKNYREACIQWVGVDTVKIADRPRAMASVAAECRVPPSASVQSEEGDAGRAFTGVTKPALQEPIAVIGMCGRYAQADTLDAFWENLKAGKDCVTEIPSERWSLDGFFHANAKEAMAQGKSYSKWGSFLEGFADFDPLFFNISPLEAMGIDPQERLFLESSWEVLESAGYTRAQLEKTIDSNVGVFAGITKTGFDKYSEDWKRMGETAKPYTSFSSVANRVSYLLNLKGPSMPIDTMCSSSLTAVHAACEELRHGGCEMAIAGGVNLYLHPSSYVGLCGMGMLSKEGRCRSFGEGGDGFVPGEGVGVVLLKPLSKAIRDRDPIHAVIRGTTVNHGGKTNGYSVPNPAAQAKLIRDALDKAGVDARAVSYIEAHGTGTELGDPIEVNGLSQAFAQDTQDTQYCALGSAKSNLGHLESAAGIAGLSKVVLQMKHGQLAPSLHVKQLNPRIPFSKTPFKVQQDLESWQRPVLNLDGQQREYPRVAGISSFGAGGANAHIIIEEPPAVGVSDTPNENVMIVLSAKSEERLLAYARKLHGFVSDPATLASVQLADLAYTLQVGREAMPSRLGFVVSSLEELKEKLAVFIEGGRPEGCHVGQVERYQKEGLAAFGGDEDLALTINAWYTKRKYTNLLALWVKGLSMDWERLYGASAPRRIVLPTYPFARERYWIEVDSNKTASDRKARCLHPMLHANTSDLRELRFSSNFSGKEFFITDHLVNGAKILPGVAYLEMARAGIESITGGSVSDGFSRTLKNVVWLRPIEVGADGADIHLRIIESAAGVLDFEVYTGVGASAVVHCQGVAATADIKALPSLDLNALKKAASEAEFSATECYAAFDHFGIEYGPGQQGISRLSVGAGQVLARLAIPASVAGSRGEFLLHPSLLDAAFQSAIGLFLHQAQKTESGGHAVLPFALEAVEVFAACPSSVWASVRPFAADANATGIWKMDIDLFADDGTVCVRMQGVTFRQLGPASSTATNTEMLLSTPEWLAKPVKAGAVQPILSEHTVLLCGFNSVPDDALANMAENRNCQTLSISSTALEARFEELSVQVFQQVQQLLSKQINGQRLVQVVLPVKLEASLASGLSALLKTAQRENPLLVGQIIAADSNLTAIQLLELVKANAAHIEDSHIRYVRDQRTVLSWSEVDDLPEIPCKAGGVYLITGGAGGIGRIFTEYLAHEAPGATFVLTGRSALSETKCAELDHWESSGAKIEYHQSDVSQRDAVIELIDTITRTHGRLDGIIHCAGILRDRYILKKSVSEFKEVLAAKVAGTVYLDKATQTMDLDFFVLFSAMGSVFGNPGQVDYVAANAFMDGFSVDRNQLVADRQRHGQTVSINWPYWKSGGMALDAAYQAEIEHQSGMVPIEAHAGVQACFQALASGKSQVAVMAGDVRRLRSLIMAAPVPKTSAVPSMRPASSDAGSPISPEAVLTYLVRLLSSTLRVPSTRIHPDEPMSELGIDSIVAMNLTSLLEKDFGSLSRTLFFEYQTVRALAGYFISNFPDKVQALMVSDAPATPRAAVPAQPLNASEPSQVAPVPSAPVAQRRQETLDVAIVGLSGRYPEAKDLDAFWANLREGRDCITEVPRDRWDWQDYYSDNPTDVRAHRSKWGGFIADVDKFDPQFFNISPKIAPYLDPQERLFLEETWKALEDAGYRRKDFQNTGDDYAASQVGVYAGVMYGEYQFFGVESSLAGQPAAFAANPASIANRVSYVLNLHGPSMTVDTMCSSSLTAIHLACQDLKSGRTNLGIAGGVNVTIHPNKYTMLSGGQFISSDGRCESFGEGGDGYIPSEGVGVVVLKRLEDAERDGDHVYGLIKGSAVNHGGRTNGFSVPNPNAQGWVINQALKEAKVDPRAISYIEAHGTGTKLGDPIEIAGLSKAFGTQPKGAPCWIGSAKSNIGHCESAAGIAGLTKILLQLKHGQIAPSLHSKDLNPHIDFASTPFVVNQELRAWDRPIVDGQTVSRMAGLSSFGAGGSNAHLLVEEYGERAPIEVLASKRPPVLIVLSAKQADRLVEVARNLSLYLETNVRHDDVSLETLHAIAYTLQVGREEMDVRFGMTVQTAEELLKKLRSFIAGQSVAGAQQGEIDYREDGPGALSFEAKRAAVEACWDGKDYTELLALWVQGYEVDWSRLYGASHPRRISLPVYPFKRQRFWAGQDAELVQPIVAAGTSGLPDPASINQPDSAPLEKPRGLALKPLPSMQAPLATKAIPAAAKVADKPAVSELSSVVQAERSVPSGTLLASLSASLSDALFMEAGELNIDKPFIDLGLDSIVGVEWIKSINTEYGLSLSAALIYEHPNLRLFANYLEQQLGGSEVFVESPTTAEPTLSDEVAQAEQSDSLEKLMDGLSASLSEALYMEAGELNIDKPFVDLGLDSIVGVEWIKAINTQYSLSISAAKIYEHPSLRQFAVFLDQEIHGLGGAVIDKSEPPVPASEPQPAETMPEPQGTERRPDDVAQSESARTTDIAIIGMSGQFPGAPSLEEYWKLLVSGSSAFTPLPDDRGWDLDKIYSKTLEANRTYVRQGGFLKGIDQFDPLFFQISPKEALTMDPAERLFLQESWKAIEDAGIGPMSVSGRKWGVFCGNGGDYSLLIKEVSGYSPHVTLSQVPARVSYHLNLTGPCLSVDSACGSALLAVAQGCDHIVSGKCEVAIAGGVFIHSTPNLLISASQVELLTASDRACALDVRSKGMTPSEAAGVVLLKPLADALKDGDRIHGVIEGWGNNHNGKTNSMVSASAESQEALFSEVYESFGIDPATISLLEANASGMPMADATEVKALTQAFRKATDRKQYCALGCVENNVGHAFHASGMSHLMKVLLALKHREIPATINVEQPDPSLDLVNSPFYINDQSQPWDVPAGQSRRAGVSSFGATGANVHMVLSEAPTVSTQAPKPQSSEIAQPGSTLIVLSAKSKAALQRSCRNLKAYLDDLKRIQNLDLNQLSANLLLRKSHYEERCAFVVSNIDALGEALSRVVEGRDPVDGFVGSHDLYQKLGPSLVLLAEGKVKAIIDQTEDRQESLLVLADLYVKGVPFDLSAAFNGSQKAVMSLPTYPFEARRCWITGKTATPLPLTVMQAPEVTPLEASEERTVLETLIEFLQEMTGYSSEEIGSSASLSDCGVDSLMGMRFLNRINMTYSTEFDASLLTHGSVQAIAEIIREADVTRSREGAATTPDDINSAWVRPVFIDYLEQEVASDTRFVDAEKGAQQLEQLIEKGVGLWKEGACLCFEFSKKAYTREMVLDMLDAPEALFALLEDGKRYFPTSFMQQFTLFETEVNKRATFNIGQGFKIEMPVDLELLNQALNQVVARHSIFRTGASKIGGQWMQVVHGQLTLTCKEVCWPEVRSEEDFLEALNTFQLERNDALFDIEQTPLFDVYLLHNQKDFGAVYFHAHHFHIDGFTLFLFQQELDQCYQALQKGQPYAGARQLAEYAHFALVQSEPKQQATTDFWFQRLRGKRSGFELRDKKKYLRKKSTKACGHELTIPDELLAELQVFNQKHQTTLTQLVTSALAIIVYRLSGINLPIQMVYNLRDRYEFETVLGDFSSSLPVILDIQPNASIQDVFKAYDSAMLNLQSRKHFDFIELQKRLNPEGDDSQGRGLLGSISIDSNDRDALVDVTDFAERLFTIPMEERIPVAPLLVCVVKTHGRLTLPVMYDPQRFSAPTIRLILDNLVDLLRELISNSESSIQNIGISPKLYQRLALEVKS